MSTLVRSVRCGQAPSPPPSTVTAASRETVSQEMGTMREVPVLARGRGLRGGLAGVSLGAACPRGLAHSRGVWGTVLPASWPWASSLWALADGRKNPLSQGKLRPWGGAESGLRAAGPWGHVAQQEPGPPVSRPSARLQGPPQGARARPERSSQTRGGAQGRRPGAREDCSVRWHEAPPRRQDGRGPRGGRRGV